MHRPPTPGLKAPCRHPPLRRQHTAKDVTLVDERQPGTTTSTCPQDDLHNRERRPPSPRTAPQAPPPSRRHHVTQERPTKLEGSPVQVPPARRRLPPSEPSAVDPRRRPIRDHISSRRGRSKSPHSVPTPSADPNFALFSGRGKSAKTPLNSLIGIVKQTAR